MRHLQQGAGLVGMAVWLLLAAGVAQAADDEDADETPKAPFRPTVTYDSSWDYGRSSGTSFSLARRRTFTFSQGATTSIGWTQALTLEPVEGLSFELSADAGWSRPAGGTWSKRSWGDVKGTINWTAREQDGAIPQVSLAAGLARNIESGSFFGSDLWKITGGIDLDWDLNDVWSLTLSLAAAQFVTPLSALHIKPAFNPSLALAADLGGGWKATGKASLTWFGGLSADINAVLPGPGTLGIGGRTVSLRPAIGQQTQIDLGLDLDWRDANDDKRLGISLQLSNVTKTPGWQISLNVPLYWH